MKVERIYWEGDNKKDKKTENELLECLVGIEKAYMFRNGYIQPMKGVGSRTLWIQLLYKIIGVLYGKSISPAREMQNTVNIGKAMICCLDRKFGHSNTHQ